jgi:hypothetical protein
MKEEMEGNCEGGEIIGCWEKVRRAKIAKRMFEKGMERRTGKRKEVKLRKRG